MNNYNERWQYTDREKLNGYRKSVRNVGVLALITLATMYAVMFGLTFIVSAVAGVAMAGNSSSAFMEKYSELMSPNGNIMLIIQIISSIIPLTIPYFVFVKIKKKRLSDYLSIYPAAPPKAPLVIVVTIALLYCATVFGNMFFAPLREIGIQMREFEAPLPTTALGMILNFLAIAVAPPICEEFAFRGIILGELLPYGETPAIVISAILFGSIHCTPLGYFYAIMAGLIFGWVTVKTGSIFFAIILHAIFNGLSFAFQVVTEKLPDQSEMILTVYQVVIIGIALIGLIYMIASKYSLSLKSSLKNPPALLDGRDVRKGFFHPSTVIFIVITIVMAAAFNFEVIL